MIRTTLVCGCSAFCLVFLPAVGFAQTVINAPPKVIGELFTVTDGQTLNVGPGGVVGLYLRAASGAVVNIDGGNVGSVGALSNGLVNVNGGVVGGLSSSLGGRVEVTGGAIESASFNGEARVSGGVFGREFFNGAGSNVELVGGDFRLNGHSFSDETITLGGFDSRDVLTGTLSDGSPFIFTTLYGGGQFRDQLNGVVLTKEPLPPVDLTPLIVDASTAAPPTGLREGQSLTVRSGGSLADNFAVVDAALHLAGGDVGRGLEVARSTVTISDGEVGNFFNSYAGSSVSISGGTIGFRFEATDSIVDISGGTVGSLFHAHSGTVANITGGHFGGIEAGSASEVNIAGGTIGFGGNLYSSLVAGRGSRVRITGGSFSRSFRTVSGSDVELIGGDFRLNGSPYIGDQLTMNEGDLFTGTLSDGSVFVFSPDHGDDFQGVTITQSDVPELDHTPRVVNQPITSGPSGLRAGQTMTVEAGGVLPDNFAVVDATLHVNGGDAGRGVEVIGGAVTITGGRIGSGLLIDDADVSMSGGYVGERSAIYNGGVLSKSGGVIDSKFNAFSGSEVRISGGSVGRDFRAWEGSHVELIGNDFKRNGVPYAGDEIELGARGVAFDVFTGTLEDGSTFIFSPGSDPLGDSVNGVKLIRVSLPALDLTPKVVDGSTDASIYGLRPGQTLTVLEGGEIPNNFAILDASLNVEGGTVGNWLEATGGEIHVSGGVVGGGMWIVDSNLRISGGRVDGHIDVFPGSTVDISSGEIGSVDARGLTVINVSGGSFTDFFFQAGAAEVNISGGLFDTRISTNSSVFNINGGEFHGTVSHRRGVLNISGGNIESIFDADDESVTNLFGTDFELNGAPLEGLAAGIPIELSDASGTLSGVLMDGTSFTLEFSDIRGAARNWFRSGSVITVTLAVPEPTTSLLVFWGCCALLSQRSQPHS